jgi:hypothetical protein
MIFFMSNCEQDWTLSVLSVIELITKFVGALSFDVELPSSSFVKFLQLVNAHAITNAATIATTLENCFIKSSNDFIIFLILGEVEQSKTSPKGLFQVLWVVYTTQICKEKIC